VLDTKLKQQTDYHANAEQLRKAIPDYLNIETLTPFILNKLIENIQVGQAETVNGQIAQEVTIVRRFIVDAYAFVLSQPSKRRDRTLIGSLFQKKFTYASP